MMDEILYFPRACNIRETPCGPNVKSTTTLKSGKRMDRYAIWFFIASPSSEDSVRTSLAEFVKKFLNENIQMAYHIAVQNSMTNVAFIAETVPQTVLFEKLNIAVQNITYHKLDSMSQVFCDDTIHTIMTEMFSYGKGVSSSMWDIKVRKLAFGDQE